jgi:hypothetical protein
VDIHRDAASIVPQGAGAVDVKRDVNPSAMTGQMLIDGIVQNLKDAVVEASFVCWANVHARPLAHAGEAFELVNFRGVVELVFCDGSLGFRDV